MRSAILDPMLQYIALGELLLCWIAWMLAFVKPSREAAGQKKAERDVSSRWGITLVAIGFGLVWAYVRPVGFHKSSLELISAMVIGPPSAALAWASAPRLGKQWRFEAAVSEDHELIQTGAYRWLRHPIYASIFGMFLTVGFAWTWWPMFLAAIVFFIAGTEIRIAAEERLLTKRFPNYAEYRARTKAYIPFIR
jgi:protein-S-isoprenylcysteine O-methyltransferase Ste14